MKHRALFLNINSHQLLIENIEHIETYAARLEESVLRQVIKESNTPISEETTIYVDWVTQWIRDYSAPRTIKLEFSFNSLLLE